MKEKISYDISEQIGDTFKTDIVHSNWCKDILKSLIEGNIVNIPKKHHRMQLTDYDADELVDTLLTNGYGSFDVIESVYKERLKLRGD